MAKQDGPVMSEDSISFLQDAKKGKARKFAMICKGTSVVSLVVYKKGNVEKRKKEAKESGKGQFYFGTVDGSGPSLRFVLARSDGFESEPVKTAALRSFLEESADFKCKPYFEIVDTPSLVLDESDPLVNEFLKLQPSALAACDAHPDRATLINNLCLQIGTHFDQDQSAEAAQRLEELKVLLRELGSAQNPVEAGQFSNSNSGSATAGVSDSAAQPIAAQPIAASDWSSKLAAWLPTIKSVIAAKGPNVPAIVKLLTEANALSKSVNGLEQAVTKLTDCYRLATQNVPDATPNPSDQFNARLKSLLPQVKAIADEALKEQAKALALQAGGLAQQKAFDQANVSLDSLERLLAGNVPKQPEIKSAGKSPRGLVAYTKLLLDWRKAQAQVVNNLSSIGNSLLNRDDVKSDPRFEQVKAAVAAMPSLIPAFGEELSDLIDAAMSAGPGPKADESLRNAKVVLARYRSLLKSAVTLQRLELLAAKHTNVESNVYSLLDATLAALEREFEARTAQ
ncbi:MAG: hypothetical protein SFV81_25905 [Pirellulaceae bacterium]|nr:hypothetical protein [Pirellulaceae bacterium]